MGAAWRVKLIRRAVRQLDELPDGARRDCLDLIEELRMGDFEDRALALRGHRRFERIRFHREAYRMIYRIDRQKRMIVITRITKRDEGTYKGFNSC